jgi:hypothetical protein
VLDLYARTYQHSPLGADEYVISADEKPSIQARDRCHRTAPAGPGRSIRVDHDYCRGALAYLAAYDVHHGQVFGRCEPSTGIEAFTRLVDQVMTTEPYASATHSKHAPQHRALLPPGNNRQTMRRSDPSPGSGA